MSATVQPLTYSDECDRWLLDRRTKEAEIARAAEVWKDPAEKAEPRRTSPEWTRTVAFTPAEWQFVWSRFRQVSLPMLGFARRLQKSTTDVMSLSAEQRCWVLALAFKYRRKVFFNPRAGKLNEEQFVNGVRTLAARKANLP